MKIVLAIGNPEEKYARTRHNLGWMVAEELDREMRSTVKKKYFNYWSVDGVLENGEWLVIKPTTYVNLTGKAVEELRAHHEDLGPDKFIVVCDDIALPLGAIRIREKGSSGGHNGLRSIEDALGTNQYARMRLGVGHPGPVGGRDYVLGKFGANEMKIVNKTVKKAVEALKCWADQGIGKAMSQFNQVDPQED